MSICSSLRILSSDMDLSVPVQNIQMSTCLSGGGGGRAYGFDLDLVKSPSPSPSSRSSHSSSAPSSILSESSSSVPLAISTKKSRTSRKRPNQTYDEAAALLAKIYPSIFSIKYLEKHCKLAKPNDPTIDTSDLLPPFPGLADAGFLIHRPMTLTAEKPVPLQFGWKTKVHLSSPRHVPLEIDLREDDFDAGSILDEEIGEGIDSIMGNPTCECEDPPDYSATVDPYLGHFGGIFQVNVTRALKQVGNVDWWCSPTVEMQNLVPKLEAPPSPGMKKKKKKKKKKKQKKKVEMNTSLYRLEQSKHRSETKSNDTIKSETEDSSSSSSPPGCLKLALSLNLNYEGVMKEWSGKGSPFPEVGDSSESPADIVAMLSDIDLLSSVAASGGMRDASAMRYKEKKRSRLSTKRMRCQVGRSRKWTSGPE